MGILKNIDHAVAEWNKRREEKQTEKNNNKFDKFVKRGCPMCGHKKMRYKNGKFKCTKCGQKVEL